MATSIARTYFSSLLSKLEKKRQVAMSEPLTMREINMLLSMRFNDKLLFDSIEFFYTDEYKNSLKTHTNPGELEKVVKFRPATPKEANLLYSDIHTRDEKELYATSSDNSEG